MRKYGLTTLVIGGLTAAILGVGVPALAVTPSNATLRHSVADGKNGVDDLVWLDNIRPKAMVPLVDTSLCQSC
ncbi:hypothetical protein [Mycobacterium sp. URHB0021]|jgi:hypothetical protein